MKIFDLKTAAEALPGGETILGSQETGSHACYLIYGVLRPGEKNRLVKPGTGHEEIVLAVRGDLRVTGHYSGELAEGHAFHTTGEEMSYLENPGDTEALYVIAGGHSGSGHH